MLIGDIDDSTVSVDETLNTIAPNSDTVAEQGTSARTLRVDEALPLLAISSGASLVRTDERIAPADGIGAVLRCPMPTLRQAARRHNGRSGTLLHRRRATTLEAGPGDPAGDLGT
jgi:hypothetical protein